MLKNRVNRGAPSNRIGQAMARPGMDTRVWLTEGVVKSVSLSSTKGPYAEVLLLATAYEDDNGEIVGRIEKVRLTSPFAGDGWGMYSPIEVDDEVLVAFPDGDPDAGGWVVQRAWSGEDKPPSGYANDTFLVHVKDGHKLKLKAKDSSVEFDGNGNVTVAVSGTGKVKLQYAALTGGVDIAPNGSPTAQVLVQGALDSMGVPVTQAPAFTTHTVKVG